MVQDYREIIQKIGGGNSIAGKEKLDSRLSEMQKTIDAFLEEANYPDYIECNDRILYHVVLDYFADIVRLKEFHNIEHTKKDKVIAYLSYWFLKRKPIQINKYSDSEKDIFVNERFVCNLVIKECLDGAENAVLSKSDAERFDKYVDLLLYYFKYRQYNPQTIELLIESFKIGRLFCRTE